MITSPPISCARGGAIKPLRSIEEGLKNNPLSAQNHINFGVALIQMGRSEDAIVQFQDALKLDDRYAIRS